MGSWAISQTEIDAFWDGLRPELREMLLPFRCDWPGAPNVRLDLRGTGEINIDPRLVELASGGDLSMAMMFIIFECQPSFEQIGYEFALRKPRAA